MSKLALLDEKLKTGIELLKDSKFYKEMMSEDGERVLKLYREYLRYCYHFVSLSAAFTPLAARRMELKHLSARKWILEHSGEEMGHELMALNDLAKLKMDTQKIQKENAPIGVVGYVSFFHYKVTMANPWSAFGVLFLLEGMASALAPMMVKNIAAHLGEVRALSFFKEHGELDSDHLGQQRKVLEKADLSGDDLAAIAQTITETAQMKRFMLDQLISDLKG